jgi:hypothetical protein
MPVGSYNQSSPETAPGAGWRLSSRFISETPVRAAAAGQLNLHDQAKAALEELLVMRPDFPSRVRDLMRRVVFLEEHIDMLLEGLFKAGLKLSPA